MTPTNASNSLAVAVAFPNANPPSLFATTKPSVTASSGNVIVVIPSDPTSSLFVRVIEPDAVVKSSNLVGRLNHSMFHLL